MRRFALVLLIPALALAAGACGDDKKDGASSSDGKDTTEQTDGGSGSSDQSFVDKMVENFTSSSDGVLTKENAECAAAKLDGELSAKAKGQVSKEDADLTTLAKDDQDAVINAFDECVPIDALADTLTSTMADSSMPAETQSCIASSIKDKFDSSGDLMRVFLLGSENAQSELTDLYTGCLPKTGEGSIAGQIASELEKQGITTEQAQCVSNSLTSKYSVEELAGLESGNLSSEIQQTLLQVMTQCGVDPTAMGN